MFIFLIEFQKQCSNTHLFTNTKNCPREICTHYIYERFYSISLPIDYCDLIRNAMNLWQLLENNSKESFWGFVKGTGKRTSRACIEKRTHSISISVVFYCLVVKCVGLCSSKQYFNLRDIFLSRFQPQPHLLVT